MTKTQDQVDQPACELIDIVARHPVRAGGFIVTVFGDIALPGDGELWMGDLITVCAGLGISESRVRTAMSRLVNERQLVGSRRGRRSYYALTPEAWSEFAVAAQRIYAAPPDCDWRLAYLPRGVDPAALGTPDLAVLRDRLVFGPDTVTLPEGAAIFTAPHDVAVTTLRDMVADAFTNAALAEDYGVFDQLCDTLQKLRLADALTILRARLLLTHHFRRIALREPRLPARVLQPGHPSLHARGRFAALYKAFSMHAAPLAESIVTLPPENSARRHKVLESRNNLVEESLHITPAPTKAAQKM